MLQTAKDINTFISHSALAYLLFKMIKFLQQISVTLLRNIF